MSKPCYWHSFVSCLVVFASINSANAQIIQTGEHLHTYNGVDDPWNVGAVYVGLSGTGTLSIAGGSVVNNTGFGILAQNSGSSGSATVTGPGSQLNNLSNLHVGFGGVGELNVEAGGVVTTNTNGNIGVGLDSMGIANVTGLGSELNISSQMVVGSSGIGELNVESGAVVTNTDGSIGWFSGMGTATVTGSGSQWNNSGGLTVGGSPFSAGGTGILNIQDEGTVSVGGTLKIWDAGTVNLESGFLNTQSLDVTASGSTLNQTGGTLTIDAGNLSTSATTFQIDSDSSLKTSSLILDNGATWNHAAAVFVGGNNNATFDVQQGSVVSSNSGYLGALTGSKGTATVTGPGSQWNNSNQMRVGNFGAGELNVEAGGVVSNTTIGYIGTKSGSMGTATVTGAGSQWNNSSQLRVGDQGTGQLNVQADGFVSSTDGYIGTSSGSMGTATVTGTGSQWNNSNDLFVGYRSTGELNVEAGGLVSNSVGYIGYGPGSMGTATVTGSGSQLNNALTLYVGFEGVGELNVEAGGVISHALHGYIGDRRGSLGTATVTGAGSQWNNSNDLVVGHGGTGGLNVEAGGVVSNTDASIGNAGIGTATVTGQGSQWNNSRDLFIGYAGTGELNVEAGGVVSNAEGFIGHNSNGVGTATVTGPGSQWNNTADLNVGFQGTGTLNILDGGVVSNVGGRIGEVTGSTGNVTVSGAGSTWHNSNFLDVGNDGNGTLNVSAGGVVNSDRGFIGQDAVSIGIANVDGAGSQWAMTDLFRIGDFGTGTLNLTNGGQVSSTHDVILGDKSGASGTVLVDGTGSMLASQQNAIVGNSGSGELNIQDNGIVSVVGTLEVGDFGTVNLESGILTAETLDVMSSGGEFNMVGGILDVEHIVGLFTQDGGVLAPGDSPGTTSISEDYVLNSGAIGIELAGLTQGTQYDFVDVSGSTSLGGGASLNISFLNDFQDDILTTDIFTILTSGSGITGTFAGFANGSTIQTIDGFGSFTINYTSQSVQLSNFVSVPEPTCFAMSGIAMLGLLRRRRVK